MHEGHRRSQGSGKHKTLCGKHATWHARDHTVAGDTAAEADMDTEVDPIARVLTSDTQSITSTLAWLLGKPQPPSTLSLPSVAWWPQGNGAATLD